MKTILVSRNELREIENIGARDVDALIDNFLLQVREFLFLINLFSICLCQKPLLARTSLVRVFTQTTREYNPVRRTFYDVNYMYSRIINSEFKIYDATIAKTSLKIASSSFRHYLSLFTF